MEGLTKHQIILLTLLVSFITSIATGIVTVALMNQAPIGVSQTINRVVERTIETVAATSTPSKNNPEETKETVVVSEDSQVVSAINNNTQSVVRIFAEGVDPKTGLPTSSFVGLGAVIASNGTIATDNGVIDSGGKYSVQTSDGISYNANVLEADDSQIVALLEISTTSTSTSLFSGVTLASNDLQLGQAVVYIGGETKNSVATGIVSSLGTKNISATSTEATSSATSTQTVETQIVSIDTSVPAGDLIPGGLLFDLSGELVGVKSAYPNGDTFFAPISAIQSALSFVSSQKKQ